MQSVITLLDSYRPNSEDRAEVIERPDGRVIVVADGVGGRAGGGEAAGLAVRTIRELLPVVRNLGDRYVWAELLAEVDAAIDADPDAGETTAVVVAVSRAGIAGASVGDSEAWLIGSGGYRDLTAGARRKPYLGYAAAVPVSFAHPKAEGTLLVATDGLFKYASPEQICEAARGSELPVAARALVELARLPSGLPDDVAMVLVRG